MKEFTAIVKSCTQTKDGYIITLDKTAFYPVGGGQPSDTGTINNLPILAVNEREGIILHQTNEPIEIGLEARCVVNWQDRFFLMQEHTGEHIVSGIIKKQYGLNNVGFHMGSGFVTIDIDGMLTTEDIAAIEHYANEAVYKNITVDSGFVSPKSLHDVEFRSKREFTEDVRIVSIAGYDTCACCGIHVMKTGEIGIIKIIDYHKYKKGMRFYMLCGFRALKDYTEKNIHVRNISEMLSSKRGEIVEAVKQILDESAALRRQLAELRQRRISHIASSVPEGTNSICIFEDGFTADDLRKLCSAISEKAKIAAVFSEKDGVYTYSISSRSIDVRPITKELNTVFSGKGGGNANLTGGSISGGKKEIQQLFNTLNL